MNDFENYELRRESSETVDNEYKINKLLERCTFYFIQCKKLMGKLLGNTTAGCSDFSSLPKAYAGPESKAETPKYKPINLKSKP